MAATTITEDVKSRDLSETQRNGEFSRTMERSFTITGEDDPGEAAALGPQYAEAYGDGSLDLFVIERRFSVLMVEPHPALKLVCRYGTQDLLARKQLNQGDGSDDFQRELGAMGETVHIVRAISQLHYPVTADAVGDLINVDSDGRITGVDVYRPKSTYREKRTFDALDAGYWRMLSQLAGHSVNKSAWKLWQDLEVLFLGATANQRGRGKWYLEYNFAISLTATKDYGGGESGPGIVIKGGHEYLWEEHARVADTAGENMTYAPKAVHVAQVYDLVEFSCLGLGV